MDLSIFLGKVLGYYLVVTSVILFYRKKALRRAVNNLIKEDMMMVFFFGSIITIIGLLWVLSHNVWDTTLSSIVSVFAWLTLAKGIMYLGLPFGWFKKMAKWFNGSHWYTVWPIVGLGLGIYILNQIYLWF